MGFTSEAMSLTLSAIGFRSVANIKALYLFKKGEANQPHDLLSLAQKSGEKLYQTIALAHSIKNQEQNRQK